MRFTKSEETINEEELVYRLHHTTATDTFLSLVDRLERNELGVRGEWILREIMRNGLGSCMRTTNRIVAFENNLWQNWLDGLNRAHGYVGRPDIDLARDYFEAGLRDGDPLGRYSASIARQCHPVDRPMYARLSSQKGNAGGVVLLSRCFMPLIVGTEGMITSPDGAFEEAERCSESNPTRAIALYSQAWDAGMRKAGDVLRRMRFSAGPDVLPGGTWRPKWWVHMLLGYEAKLAIFRLLLCAQRDGCIVASLPKDVVLRVCLFISCPPGRIRPSCTLDEIVSVRSQFAGLQNHQIDAYARLQRHLDSVEGTRDAWDLDNIQRTLARSLAEARRVGPTE